MRESTAKTISGHLTGEAAIRAFERAIESSGQSKFVVTAVKEKLKREGYLAEGEDQSLYELISSVVDSNILTLDDIRSFITEANRKKNEEGAA